MIDTAELVKLATHLREAAYFCTALPDLEMHCRSTAERLESLAAQQDGATPDDLAGIAWWNSMSDEDREKWAQSSGRAVDAWTAFKAAAQQDGADFVRLPIEAVRNSGCPSDTRMRVGECTDAGTCGCSLMLRERVEQPPRSTEE